MQVKFINASHSYEKKKRGFNPPQAMKDINLEVNEGDFVMVCGRTGSGKSTLMAHVNGLLIPSSGEVCVKGLTITPKKRKNPKMSLIRKNVGYVFQFPEYQLFEETVLKDIIYGPMNFGMSQEEAVKKAHEVSKMLGIESLLKKSPFDLSGGQMRKVAIAGVLASDPDILLLDEPTRGLDPLGAKEIMSLFETLNKKYHKTIIMISHDMDIVYRYASRLVIMKDGQIQYDSNKFDVFRQNYMDLEIDKPRILKSIDYLNENLNLNLKYEDNVTMEDLLHSLESVC